MASLGAGMERRIAVLGTGANGSCIAADLVRAGRDVVAIDQWPAQVEAMRAHGLRIDMPADSLHVAVEAHHVCDLAALRHVYDIVLLCVKAYDTRWACELIAPHLAADGLLVGVQNGMTAGDIVDVVGAARTIGCVVELSSEIFTPGVVQRNTPPAKTWFGLGSLDGAAEDRLAEVAELLRDVGQVSVSPDIVSAKWMKLVVNTMCLGPLAMMGLPVGEALKVPGAHELVMKVGTEALAVGQSLGYRIEPIFGLTPADMRDTNRLLEKLLGKLAGDVGPAARDCVLQDHLKGRYSEVDAINGLVVAQSARLGRPAPANAAIVEITRQIHAGALRPDPATVPLAHRLISG